MFCLKLNDLIFPNQLSFIFKTSLKINQFKNQLKINSKNLYNLFRNYKIIIYDTYKYINCILYYMLL